MFQQGQRSMIAFLKHFVRTHDLPKREKKEVKEETHVSDENKTSDEQAEDAKAEDAKAEVNSIDKTTDVKSEEKPPDVKTDDVIPVVAAAKDTEPESVKIVIQNAEKENESANPELQT